MILWSATWMCPAVHFSSHRYLHILWWQKWVSRTGDQEEWFFTYSFSAAGDVSHSVAEWQVRQRPTSQTVNGLSFLKPLLKYVKKKNLKNNCWISHQQNNRWLQPTVHIVPYNVFERLEDRSDALQDVKQCCSPSPLWQLLRHLLGVSFSSHIVGQATEASCRQSRLPHFVRLVTCVCVCVALTCMCDAHGSDARQRLKCLSQRGSLELSAGGETAAARNHNDWARRQ